MVNLENLIWKVQLTTLASPFLPPEQHVLVLTIILGSVYISPLRYVCACRNEPVVKEASHCLLKAHIHQFSRFR